MSSANNNINIAFESKTKSFSNQKKNNSKNYMNSQSNKDRSFQNKKTQNNQKSSNQQQQQLVEKTNFSTILTKTQNTSSCLEDKKTLQKSMSEQFKQSDFMSRKYHERYQKSLADHQNNLKILQDIQERALKLREKQKNQRETLKKLKKLYLKKLQQLKQSESFTKQTIQQKDRQIQFLNIQNEQLRQKNAQFITAIQQINSISQRNQQLQKENQKLSQDFNSMKEQYKLIKMKYDQQLELMDEGIRSKKIQEQLPSLNNNVSLRDLEQLARALSQNKSQAQKLAQQLTVSQQNLQKVQKIVKQKQLQIASLNFNLNEIMQNDKKNQQKSANEIQKLQQQLKNAQKQKEILNNLQKLAQERQKQIKQNNKKVISSFEQNIIALLQKLKIKQYALVYDIFSDLVNQFFDKFNQENQVLSQNIETCWVGIINKHLVKLNDFFRMKAEHDLERIQKVKQYMKSANTVINKIGDDESTPQKIFISSSPQGKQFHLQLNSLKKQMFDESQHSSRSQSKYLDKVEKSILLEEDMNNAISQKDDINEKQEFQTNLKSELLEQQANKQKQNPLMNSQVKPAFSDMKDNDSEQSFSKSMTSSMSHAEKNASYKANVRNAKLNAKLKKHK